MQPLSGPGSTAGDRSAVSAPEGTPRPGTTAGEQSLSPAQRTTLERLIVRIISVSSLKAPELWAGIQHEVGVKSEADIQSRHFPAAERYLSQRLTQAQSGLEKRQMLTMLTELLPQGNNRQAVSDFIRQQFGLTVLSALSQDQLRQVLTMLKNGEMVIPQPQQSPVTDRSLLPAEHQTLQQQIARLAAATGEPTAKIWATALKLTGLSMGDPIPVRHFPLLTQYLQVRQTLSQHSAPTLQVLEASLKQPLGADERALLEQYCQNQFQLTPQSLLSPTQAQDLLNQLFAHRAERRHNALLAASELNPQPLWASWVSGVPLLQPMSQRPLLLAAVILAVVLVLWVLL